MNLFSKLALRILLNFCMTVYLQNGEKPMQWFYKKYFGFHKIWENGPEMAKIGSFLSFLLNFGSNKFS